MAKIKRKYIESHWLFFIIEGAISLLFGWYAMFSGIHITALIAVVGCMLLILGLIELFNVLQRKRHEHSWGLSLGISAFELIVALALLLSLEQNPAVALVILSIYTLARGIFEILIATKTTNDPTDKFIWFVCGICGVVFAFVLFNAVHLTAGTFVKVFGSYLMILGLSNLIYGVHNRNMKFVTDKKTLKSSSRSKKRK